MIPRLFTVAFCVLILAGCGEDRERRLAASNETITTPSGKTFRCCPAGKEKWIEGEEEEEISTPSVLRAPAAATPSSAPEDRFRGHDRKLAKTSIANAPVKEYQGLADFSRELLHDAPDSVMLTKGISKSEDSDRVAEERRNVKVQCFLVAVKKEADNDFHLILADSDHPHLYFTAEVSGLPMNPPPDLVKARNQFKQFFSSVTLGAGYKMFDPIPVVVSGSTFFDVDHRAGVVGPQGHRPKTAWEIHPVTDLQFEQ